MNKKSVFILILIIVLIIAAGFSITGKFAKEDRLKEKTGPFVVAKIIDGDTVRLNNGNTIRLSGINTPETQECYYNEAKQRLTQLILGKEVFLERDRTDIDKYNRLLRYIYVDNISVNFLMVEESYAKVFDKYKEDTKYYEQLKAVEQKAKNKGVWLCSNPREQCLYIASNNSKVYHNSSSTLAKRIKNENIICFQSKEQAEKAGYVYSK